MTLCKAFQYLVYLGFGVGAIRRAVKNYGKLLDRHIKSRNQPLTVGGRHLSRLVLAFQHKRTKKVIYTDHAFEVRYSNKYELQYIKDSSETTMNTVLEKVEFPLRYFHCVRYAKEYAVKFVTHIPHDKEEFFVGENDAGVLIKPPFSAFRIFKSKLVAGYYVHPAIIRDFFNLLANIARELYLKNCDRVNSDTTSKSLMSI
jgi:hypothetical protein